MSRFSSLRFFRMQTHTGALRWNRTTDTASQTRLNHSVIYSKSLSLFRRFAPLSKNGKHFLKFPFGNWILKILVSRFSSLRFSSYANAYWCPKVESNHRHKDFQSFALPTELSGQIYVLSLYKEHIGDSDGARTHDL